MKNLLSFIFCDEFIPVNIMDETWATAVEETMEL